MAGGKNSDSIKNKGLEELEKRILLQQGLWGVLQHGFQQELSLGYVYDKEGANSQELTVKRVYEELKELEKQEKGREDYFSTLQERHHDSRQHLVEYHMITEYIFVNPSEVGEDERLKAVKGRQKRLNIKGKIQGKEVNFYKLLQFIDEAIEENEKLLKESDHQLFEDILANTISKKIRAKIYNSQD